MASKRSSNKQRKTIVMVILFFVLMAGSLFFANYLSQKTEQEEVSAFGVKYITVQGNNLSLSRQKVVAKGDNVSLEAKFLNTMDADKYSWNWDVCGKKITTTTSTWYTSKLYPMDKVGNCNVKVDASAYYYPQNTSGEIGDTTVTPGSASDSMTVLPSENIRISIFGRPSAKVGETVWLDSAYKGPAGYSWINWSWQAKNNGVCRGTLESFKSTTNVGVKGEKKGTCTEILDLRVEYPNKVVKGRATKNIRVR